MATTRPEAVVDRAVDGAHAAVAEALDEPEAAERARARVGRRQPLAVDRADVLATPRSGSRRPRSVSSASTPWVRYALAPRRGAALHAPEMTLGETAFEGGFRRVTPGPEPLALARLRELLPRGGQRRQRPAPRGPRRLSVVALAGDLVRDRVDRGRPTELGRRAARAAAAAAGARSGAALGRPSGRAAAGLAGACARNRSALCSRRPRPGCRPRRF